MSEKNGNPWGNNHDGRDSGEDSNIIRIPTLAERKRAEKEARKMAARQEPLINLPPVTKWLLGVFIGLHVLIHVVLSEDAAEFVFLHFGLIPAQMSGHAPFTLYSLLSIFTHIMIHGSWLHLVMNSVMAMAFFSGVEKWIGARRTLVLFFLCAFAGAAVQVAVSPSSIFPVVGASGGLSGLFAAVLVLMNRMQGKSGFRAVMPFVALWVIISIIFGMIGAPDGSQIAWADHIGGFLAGFVVLKIMRINML